MFDRYTLIEHSPYVHKSMYSDRKVNMEIESVKYSINLNITISSLIPYKHKSDT